MPAERGAEISIALEKDAPAGMQQVALELEVLNLHVSPDRNLMVRIPLNVAVRP
ncbi:MAG: hypothetical protein U0Q18_03790 [Bryobacteraceae bacterium]